jgi:hypothetical protein
MITTRIPFESVARVAFSVVEDGACEKHGATAIARQNKSK